MLAFFAPETCINTPFSPFLLDIYAMGVTLYIFIYAKLPFDDACIIGLMETICQQNADFNETFNQDKQSVQLLKGMLEKVAKNRYTLESIRVIYSFSLLQV